jgi:glycosyltransferase involved in cell wall biosynthesis
VILAARDEERTIEECLRSLLKQCYENFEIIVADDRSTDRTAHIVQEKFPGVVCVRIDSLSDGCAGKSHALSVAQAHATGEWLLFTDADTIHGPFSIQTPLAYALRHDVRMLSLLSRPLAVGFWEKALQPVIGLFLFMLFPLERVNAAGDRMAFANGQYILITREAYDRIGGHAALLRFPLEDIVMAQNAKRRGCTVGLLYAGDVVQCRMYDSLGDLWTGWERIFFLIFSDAPWRIPVIIALIVVMSLVPYAGLWFCPWLAAAQLVFLHLASARAYAFIGADRRYVLTHPLGCAALAGILWGAFWKKVRGTGVMWKGMRYYGQEFLKR